MNVQALMQYTCGAKISTQTLHNCAGYLLNKFFTNCMRAFSIFDSNYCTNKKCSNCSKYTENNNILLWSATNKKAILNDKIIEISVRLHNYSCIFVKKEKDHIEDTNFTERKIND